MRFVRSLTGLVPLFATTALAYQFQLDQSGASQRVSGDVPYVVDANSPDITYSQVLPAIHAAFAAWSTASQGRLTFSDLGATQLGPPADGETRFSVPVTISWELGQWRYQGDDQAVTIRIEDPDTHVIARADIVFNGVTHHWADLADGLPHPGADDVQNTLTHEIGHLVGFAHPTDPTSTMYPSTYPGDLSRQTLDPQDVTGIDALYAATPTVAQQGAGCSTSGGGSGRALALLLALGLLLRRRSR